jgi:chromosome segregation ATPase
MMPFALLQIAPLPTTVEILTVITLVSAIVSAVVVRLLMPALREHLKEHFPTRAEFRKEIQDACDDTNRLGGKVGETLQALEGVRTMATEAKTQGDRLSDRIESLHRHFERQIMPTLREMSENLGQINNKLAKATAQWEHHEKRLDDHDKRIRKGDK